MNHELERWLLPIWFLFVSGLELADRIARQSMKFDKFSVTYLIIFIVMVAIITDLVLSLFVKGI